MKNLGFLSFYKKAIMIMIVIVSIKVISLDAPHYDSVVHHAPRSQNFKNINYFILFPLVIALVGT